MENKTIRDDVYEQDDAYVHEQIISNIEHEFEDYEFDQIQNHKWENGILILQVILKSGKEYEVPLNIIK